MVQDPWGESVSATHRGQHKPGHEASGLDWGPTTCTGPTEMLQGQSYDPPKSFCSAGGVGATSSGLGECGCVLGGSW